jgi:hypothetical protein
MTIDDQLTQDEFYEDTLQLLNIIEPSIEIIVEGHPIEDRCYDVMRRLRNEHVDKLYLAAKKFGRTVFSMSRIPATIEHGDKLDQCTSRDAGCANRCAYYQNALDAIEQAYVTMDLPRFAAAIESLLGLTKSE